MKYDFSAISEARIPRAQDPLFQHLLDTYASEPNKVISVRRDFSDGDLPFRPHAKSSTVLEIMKHQLLSERRFFGGFLGVPEPGRGGGLADGAECGAVEGPDAGAGSTPAGFSGGMRFGLVVDEGALLRRGTATDLDLLGAGCCTRPITERS
jgi:hypothetical protein